MPLFSRNIMQLRNCIAILSILLAACSTTIVPLRSSINTIEAKIQNPEEGKVYRLHSTSRDNKVLGKPQNVEGLLHFDISRSSKEPGKCYAFHDGTNYIPIKDNFFKFSNPAVKSYLQISNDFNSENSNLQKNEALLNSNVAYRYGQCVLLSEKDMPEKPSSACSPLEEESFSRSRCQNNTSYPTPFTAIINTFICSTVGLFAGAITINPLVGFSTGVGCKFWISDTEQENRYNLCVVNSRTDCRKTHDEWVNNKRYLENNSDKLYQGCIQVQEITKKLVSSRNNLKIELDRSAQAWTSITEGDYCP